VKLRKLWDSVNLSFILKSKVKLGRKSNLGKAQNPATTIKKINQRPKKSLEN
jgi:hypothetical protein